MPIYLHETARVRPGKIETYVEGLQTIFLPLVESRLSNARLWGCWEVVGSSGGEWSQVVMLWELDDWDAFAALRAKSYDRFRGRDDAIHLWRNDIAINWRDGGATRLLTPLSPPTTRAALADAEVPHTVVHQDSFEIVPGGHDAFCAYITEEVAPAYRALQFTLLGVHRDVTSATRTCVLYGVPSYQQWGRAQEVRMAAPAQWEWTEKALGLITQWDSLLLTPVPFSPCQ